MWVLAGVLTGEGDSAGWVFTPRAAGPGDAGDLLAGDLAAEPGG